MNSLISRRNFIERATGFEDAISQLPGAKFGDDACPVVHTFGDNLYVRQVTMPAGITLTSKIHKTTHPYFVISGECDVLTEEGTVRIKAPYWGMTKAGTKRVLRILKETVWVTVHSTKETDIDKIEEEVIAENYDALPDSVRREIEGDAL